MTKRISLLLLALPFALAACSSGGEEEVKPITEKPANFKGIEAGNGAAAGAAAESAQRPSPVPAPEGM